MSTTSTAVPARARGTLTGRRRRSLRRLVRTMVVLALLMAAGATALWWADRDDPQMDLDAWALVACMCLLVLAWLGWAAVEGRAADRAWTAALADLTSGGGDPEDAPADAILALSWDPGRHVAKVAWNGVVVGRWLPGTSRGRQLLPLAPSSERPDPPARGTVRTHPAGFADVRVGGRRFLVSHLGCVLVDAHGREWPLEGLPRPEGRRGIGSVPRVLGAEGAILVLQAYRELAARAARHH